MITVSMQFATPQEALQALSQLGASGSAPTNFPPPQTTVAPAQQPFQPAPQNFAPPPQQPQNFQPPAQPQAGNGMAAYTVQSIVPLMQQYAQMHKPAGLKAAFAKHNLPPNITQLDQNGLNTMGAFFASNQPA